MSIYKDEIELVEKLIIKEKVPTKNPKALATLALMTANYGAGDALAGLTLEKIIAANRDTISAFIYRITGRDSAPHYASLSSAFEKLGEKYEVFKALDKMAASGGNSKSLRDLAKKLDVE
jgi:hypothetical protein